MVDSLKLSLFIEKQIVCKTLKSNKCKLYLQNVLKGSRNKVFKTHVYVKDNIIVFGDKLDLETKCLGTLKCQKYEESI